MSMIQIRNVPDEMHRQLKARAALAGMSLSDYLIRELRRIAERPTRAELFERLRSQGTVALSRPAAEFVREGRSDP